MKKVVSIILACVLTFSMIGGMQLSVRAEENSFFLTEDEAMWFTNKFLYMLDESEKALYQDYLTGMNPDTDWTKIQNCVNQVQKVWGQTLKVMPSEISDSQFAKLGNSAFKYIGGTIEVFKNIDYIANEDQNALQKSYHGIQIVNSCSSMMGISLGTFGAALNVIAGTLVIADILLDANIQEAIGLYRYELNIAFYTGAELPVPPEGNGTGKEQFEKGANAVYIEYTLRRMAENMKNATFVNAVGEKCNFEGRTYQVFDISLNWTQSKEYCENLGGHLVTITDEKEQIFVSSLVKRGKKATYWLGGSDANIEGKWEWVTEEPFDYWFGDAPDNGPPGPEDWLEMIAANGKWNDGEHDGQGSSGMWALSNHGFICEWDNYIDPYPTINDEHHYTETIIHPTCTTDGYTIHQCTECDIKYYSNNRQALGHDYIYQQKTSATCTAQGYDLYKCSRCNAKENRNVVNAFGHNFVYQNTVNATCTAPGYDLYKCTRCNATEKRNTAEALGHSYKVTNRTTTCTEAGIRTETCSRCDDVKTTEESALGHTYTYMPVRPTCITQGYTERTCKRCGFIDQIELLDPLGHDYGMRIGQDYIDFLYDTENSKGRIEDRPFREAIPAMSKYGISIQTTSSVGAEGGLAWFKGAFDITYPKQIRLDATKVNDIEDYSVLVACPWATRAQELNSVFAYRADTGRVPEESAIPYTDSDGNLVNMQYVDYKTKNGWVNGTYILNDNIIEDVEGTVVCTDFLSTRPHIVYTKSEALLQGILNEDLTVNVKKLAKEITYSAGVPGIYTTIYSFKPSKRDTYISLFSYDNTLQPQNGVYQVDLCFYNPTLSATGIIDFKIYDTEVLQKVLCETEGGNQIVECTCIDCGKKELRTFTNYGTILGDVNGDGELRLSDYSQTMQAAVGAIELSEEEYVRADVNRDGAVDAFDAALLNLWLSGSNLYQ